MRVRRVERAWRTNVYVLQLLPHRVTAERRSCRRGPDVGRGPQTGETVTAYAPYVLTLNLYRNDTGGLHDSRFLDIPEEFDHFARNCRGNALHQDNAFGRWARAEFRKLQEENKARFIASGIPTEAIH